MYLQETDEQNDDDNDDDEEIEHIEGEVDDNEDTHEALSTRDSKQDEGKFIINILHYFNIVWVVRDNCAISIILYQFRI